MSEGKKAGAHASSVGILGYGLYLPQHYMSAADIAAATGGHWNEAAVRDKLGILRKTVPGPGDGTQAMVRVRRRTRLPAAASIRWRSILCCAWARSGKSTR